MFAKLTAAVLVALMWVALASAVRGQDTEQLKAQLADIDAKLARLSSYDAAAEQAVAQQKPLVVFVGTDARQIAGSVVCRVEKLPGYDAPSIVVSVPGGDWLHFRASLPTTATDAQIAAAIKGVSLPAPFFAGKPADGNVPPAVVGEVQDAINAINAARAQRGLRPYIRDDGLTAGAMRVTAHRAGRRLFGHAENDFSFLEGCTAACAGCAGNEPTWGFMACAVYENWTYCGAAWVLGSDGRLYCHAFYR